MHQLAAKYKEPMYQCPCCDYFSLRSRNGWEIYPVCYWEDDASATDCHCLDVDELDTQSSCNHALTLRKVRDNFKEFGACERSMMEHTCSSEQRSNFKYQARNLE